MDPTLPSTTSEGLRVNPMQSPGLMGAFSARLGSQTRTRAGAPQRGSTKHDGNSNGRVSILKASSYHAPDDLKRLRVYSTNWITSACVCLHIMKLFKNTLGNCLLKDVSPSSVPCYICCFPLLGIPSTPCSGLGTPNSHEPTCQ